MDDNNQIGLELSSSRGSSYNDLTQIDNEVIIPKLPLVFEEFVFENRLVAPILPIRKLTRPVSYSDSFIFLASGKKPEVSGFARNNSDQSLTLIQPFLSGRDSASINNLPAGKRKESQLINKLISITVHISLISVFENIFFWQFISKSEDIALQTTIDNFLQGTLNQCNTWSPNATQLIADLFQIFINQTLIQQQATIASTTRNQINYKLFVQSWIYYVSLLSLVVIISSITYYKKYKIKWKEVAIDNILLVVLLGIYEFTFFKTIAMQYSNITLPELENHIVSMLQDQCNI
jgi:uncharacterized membrane protein YqhA